MVRRIVSDEQVQQKAQETASQSLGLDAEFSELAKVIQSAYDEGVTMEHAERLAARCLGVQLKIAEQLAVSDLDARMKKNGMKAMRGATYLKSAAPIGDGKKPTEAAIESMINLDKDVGNAQDLYDRADAKTQSLTVYLGIFKDAHIYFRGIAKGRFE